MSLCAPAFTYRLSGGNFPALDPFATRRRSPRRPKGTPMSYIVKCDQCAQVTELTRPQGRFCSTSCRARYHRATLLSQRQGLVAEADAAVRSGDVLKLEQVARATVSLLA